MRSNLSTTSIEWEAGLVSPPDPLIHAHICTDYRAQCVPTHPQFYLQCNQQNFCTALILINILIHGNIQWNPLFSIRCETLNIYVLYGSQHLCDWSSNMYAILHVYCIISISCLFAFNFRLESLSLLENIHPPLAVAALQWANDMAAARFSVRIDNGVLANR